ncbi:class I SAM-dependent methyltransferase [Pseudoalteromonas aliena]|uniref:class I SAM-dependent methyltransferase n=1 Tax=Pseudoalteromonas aliena TaxID=247523 RepID=UPI00249424AE|nr:class I SAM-dependent methyltransferase [Pseudoalteromonas aliena]
MQASSIFNGYIGSHLCYHLGKSGIFDLFNDAEKIDIKTLTDNKNNEQKSSLFKSLIDYSLKFGLFEQDQHEKLSLTTLGKDLKKNVGFFTWAVGGYGDFIKNFTSINPDNGESFYSMVDGGDVALGSRQANRAFMWDTVVAEFDQQDIKNIVDLGSGNAGALINVCNVFDGVNGIGIDISSKAIVEANDNILNNDMQQRITVHNQNVLDAIDDPALGEKFDQVDTVMSFMMMHDLFNAQDPVKVLRKLRTTFPNANTFFIADTFLSDEQQLDADTPIFSYGFEYVHHFMNIKLFNKEDYELYFIEAGFEITKVKYLNVPNTYLYVLK